MPTTKQEGVAQESKPAVAQDKETAASSDDQAGDLDQRLSALQAQADEYLNLWRRSAADFANYKKRQERERSDFMKYANAGLITRLLPALDDFQRALSAIPDNRNELIWIEGISLIERKLWTALEQEGVSAIPATPDQPFDPAIHEALTWEETDTVGDGHIIEQVQQGYELHGRVLRPSLVRVARGVAESPAVVDELENSQGDHE